MVRLKFAANAGILLSGQLGTDLDCPEKTCSLGANNITGNGVSHIDAFFRMGTKLMRRHEEDIRKRLPQSGYRRKGNIGKEIPNIILLQDVKYLVHGRRVAYDAQLESQIRESLKHLLHPGTEGAVIVRHFPHVGDLLTVRRQFLTGKIKIRQGVVAPDGNRLELHITAVAEKAVFLPAGIHAPLQFLPADLRVKPPAAKHLVKLVDCRKLGALVYVDVLQCSAHIKHYRCDHAISSLTFLRAAGVSKYLTAAGIFFPFGFLFGRRLRMVIPPAEEKEKDQTADQRDK